LETGDIRLSFYSMEAFINRLLLPKSYFVSLPFYKNREELEKAIAVASSPLSSSSGSTSTALPLTERLPLELLVVVFSFLDVHSLGTLFLL